MKSAFTTGKHLDADDEIQSTVYTILKQAIKRKQNLTVAYLSFCPCGIKYSRTSLSSHQYNYIAFRAPPNLQQCEMGIRLQTLYDKPVMFHGFTKKMENIPCKTGGQMSLQYSLLLHLCNQIMNRILL